MKILTLIIIIFIPLMSFSQNKDTEGVFAVGLQIGYFSFSTGDSHNGLLEIRPSFHHKLSKSSTLVAEITFTRENRSSGFVSQNIFAFAYKYKPKENEGFYLKPGIGLLFVDSRDSRIVPTFNFGFGHDFRVSNKFDIIAEGNAYLVYPFGFAYSISTGLKFKFK